MSNSFKIWVKTVAIKIKIVVKISNVSLYRCSCHLGQEHKFQFFKIGAMAFGIFNKFLVGRCGKILLAKFLFDIQGFCCCKGEIHKLSNVIFPILEPPPRYVRSVSSSAKYAPTYPQRGQKDQLNLSSKTSHFKTTIHLVTHNLISQGFSKSY